MNPFEGRMLKHIDRETKAGNEKTPLEAYFDQHEQAIIVRAEDVIRQYQIQPSSFKDLYGESVVEQDEAYVQRMLAEFGPADKDRQLATVLEAVMLEQIELNDWFGDHAQTIKTSQYDDIRNGTDMIVDFDPASSEGQAKMLGLSIDVTFSAMGMEKKLDRIFTNLKEGKLNKIKYYDSETHAIRGELSRLPLVVLGIERKTVKELGALWDQKLHKPLAEHPIQHSLLTQCLDQLSAMQHVARTMRNDAAIEGAISRPRDTIAQLVRTRNSRKQALSGGRIEHAMSVVLDGYTGR